MDNNNHFNFSQIRIENTNLCAYKCIMCPREKMTRKKGIMSFEDFQCVLTHFNSFKGFLHLHGYGEPLLDPDLIKKIAFAKKKYPKSKTVIYSTLGIDLKKDWVDKLINAGLDIVFISLYGYNINTYKSIHGKDNFDLVLKNLKLLDRVNKKYNYPLTISMILASEDLIKKTKETTSFAQILSLLNYLKTLKKTFIYQFDLHNYGYGKKILKPNPNLCSIVSGYRKKNIQITWDLKVIPCCFDFNADMILGDLKTQTLQEIFSSKNYLDLIEAHKNNNFKNYPVCLNCDKPDLKKI